MFLGNSDMKRPKANSQNVFYRAVADMTVGIVKLCNPKSTLTVADHIRSKVWFPMVPSIIFREILDSRILITISVQSRIGAGTNEHSIETHVGMGVKFSPKCQGYVHIVRPIAKEVLIGQR